MELWDEFASEEGVTPNHEYRPQGVQCGRICQHGCYDAHFGKRYRPRRQVKKATIIKANDNEIFQISAAYHVSTTGREK